MRWLGYTFDAAGEGSEVPSRRSAHASCLVDGRYLLVFGGWDGTQELGDLYSYDVATHRWKRVRTTGTPPAPRHFHSVVAVGRRMYVFGGFDGDKWRADLHALHLDTWTWQEVALERGAPAPGPRASTSAAVLSDGRIFIFGGYDGSAFLRVRKRQLGGGGG